MNSKDKLVLQFYRSYYDVMMSLSKSNRLEFIEYVLKVSFFDEELVKEPFNSKQLSNAFRIIYGQLLKQKKGYVSTYKGSREERPHGQEEEEDKYKEEYKYKGKESTPMGSETLHTLSEANSYMHIKDYLIENVEKISEDFEFMFEDRHVKLSQNGKLYDVGQIDDLIKIDFDLETRALKYLLKNKGLIKCK